VMGKGRMGKRLKGKQLAFVMALPRCAWVGTDAVIEAGYRAKDRQIAGEIACELLKKPKIKAIIDRMTAESLQRAGIYAERVLLELGKIGFSDISKAYNDDGTLKLLKDWPEELKGVISGVETFEEFSGRGENRELVGFTKKLRTYDKVKALELLGKHLKIFPTGRAGEDKGLPSERPIPSNLELSAKLFYILQIAIERQQEAEKKSKEERKAIPGK
jgi:phage terminase small subunit